MANTLKFGNGEWYGKKDTILAYNDENNNYKPLPFDFSRASSATRVNKDGLIETVGSGEPRIDYKDDSKGALLLEPSRSNSLVQSNQFDTNWIGSSTSVLSGYLGLDGTNSAWLLTKTANISANIRQNITFSGIHTFSVYLKKGTNTSAILRSTGGNDARVEINLIDGTTSGAVNTTSVLTESMGNDWWRCSMTLNASSNTAVRIYPEAPLGGTTAGNIYMQYAQLEQGSYATSYIPTQGSAVTRLADFAEQDLPNDNILIDNNSTIYFEVDTTDLINNTPNTGGFNFKNSGGTSQLNFNYGYGRIYSNYYTGSTTAIIPSAEVGRYKIAFPLTNGSYLYVNGVQKSATSRDWSSISISEIEILFGHSIIDFKLYNTILSNSELQALTSN